MGILGSWSAMRRYLEREMLADALRGRIRYGCTRYVGMDGHRIFEICVDGEQIKRFSLETVNSFFIEQGHKTNLYPFGILGYWDGFLMLLDKCPLGSRTEYTDEEFCSALEKYRNQNVQVSLHSPDPIVKMFSILDRRVGRKSLKALEEEIADRPKWLQFFYRLRIQR